MVTELIADFFTWSATLTVVARDVLMVSLQLKGFLETDVSDSILFLWGEFHIWLPAITVFYT